MAEISKQALIVENNTSFPNNNNGAITPTALRNFNADLIDSTVNQTVFNNYSSSVTESLQALAVFTASVAGTNAFTASYYVASASFDSRIDNLDAWSASLDTNFASQAEFDSYTSSNDAKVNALIAFTSSVLSISALDALNQSTASLSAFTSSIAGTNTFTQSADQRLDALEDKSGSYATTGSNNFNGNQTITGSLVVTGDITANKLNVIIESSSVIFSSGSNILGDAITDTQTLNGQVTVSGDLRVNGESISGSSYTSATFSSNNIVLTKGDATTTQLNGFATTGSNAFVGNQIITGSILMTGSINMRDGGDNNIYQATHSGSLILSGEGFSDGYSHFTASAGNLLNLVFKNNTNTASTIVTGSNNIFVNPAAPTAGFKRYVGTSNIFPHASAVPQISASMVTGLPTFSGNIFNHTQTNPFTWRGPVSASSSTVNHNIIMGGQITLGTSTALSADKALAGFAVTGNALFGGIINLTAAATPLSSSINIASNLLFGAGVTLNNYSSSLTYSSNVQNGGITVNNSYLPISGSGAATLNARANVNTIYGIGHILNIAGSNTSTSHTKQFVANILAGTFLSASIGGGDNSGFLATGIIGNSLVVSGSTLTAVATGADTANSGQGSLFAGRWNALDGSKAKTGETVFAVGTGTSNSDRKTGFLIDSGSNSTFSGSVAVSGSITSNVVDLSIVSQTASLDFNSGNLFTLTLVSGSTTRLEAANIKAGQTINLLVSQPGVGYGDLVYGSTFKFTSGNSYVPTAAAAAKDIVTFLTFADTTAIYGASVKNLV